MNLIFFNFSKRVLIFKGWRTKMQNTQCTGHIILIPQAKKRQKAKAPVTTKFQGLSSVSVYSSASRRMIAQNN